MKRLMLVVLLCLCFPFMTGCPIALIAAGVGAAKAGGAKKDEAATKDKEAYGNYRIAMDKLNTDREIAGLEDKPILSYEEWSNTDNK